ncbi:MobF family relaxase [Nocardia gipuzkoensis]|uniref:MobF family relaxase n=1 Tax=Nocardia gipuzkoensis TaxID=2749991 RepID=UPI00237DAC8C|nr:MobF family relaxase [Nocardia gipuzkoensis]MDE1672670.1 MobF family relaxase [Nocardia gipuzkoensis]
MAGNLHKLSAGDGYTYLTKQVAAMDSSELGGATLADYYSMKGEAPGRWLGSGLVAFEDISPGDVVTEAQMKALFGNGRHPNADAIEAAKVAELVEVYFQRYRRRGMNSRSAAKQAADRAAEEALKYSRLGCPFKVFKQASEFRQAVATAFSDYNVARGLKWNTPLPDEVRSRIRTDVALRMFTAEYSRSPLDDRELSGWIARNSRQRTQACAGYDFTVAPSDKSISALWALAPKSISDIVLRCHLDAADDTVARFLEKYAVYTRTGANGVAQVDVKGVVATIFTHRDSRAGDPYLHSHIAISNKVQTLDGRWLALDGRAIHKFAVWASEYYNTRIETYLRQRLGLRFTERPHNDPNKRGTRAVVGIDQALCEAWSTRNAAIELRRGVLAREFQQRHGREPSPREAYELAYRAAVDTRQRKHEPRSEAEQRITWHEEAVAYLGSERAVSDMLYAALHPDHTDDAPQLTPQELDAWVDVAADAVVERVSQDRATWQINHIGAEAQRYVRAAELAPEIVDEVVERVITAALNPTRSVAVSLPDVLDEPTALRRRDGTSVYITAGTQSYTSAPIMAAEQRILDAAARRDGRRVGEVTVGVALLEYAANNPDKPLNPGQIALVRQFATSGARVELALAPAGTGKTTAMSVFARAWQEEGGTVIGLAPTANAAAVLRDEIDTTCDTIDKLIDSLRFAEYAASVGIPAKIPPWIERIDDTTMVVIDEAALASTYQLDQAIDFVLSRGGSVRLIGDDKQLAAISAGGIVRAIADTHGAHTLDHVIRFRDADGNPRTDEGAASLALRDGDPAAIGFYLDHGRVHTGDNVAITDAAYTAWAEDQRAGLDAVMMAPTHAITRELNLRARADRLATWGPTGPEIALPNDTTVSAGDVIRTTKNTRRLAMSATDWVRNGYRWRVERVHDDGALSVTHLRTGLSTVLPASYVAEHVMLGYASTIMTSQGITADTSHTVLSGNENRNDVYMALTRGARRNDLYFPTALSGDEHSVVTDAAMNPATAVDLFTAILTRDGAQKAATTLERELREPRLRLGPAVDAYVHAVGAAAESLLGAEEMARIDTAAEQLHPGLTDEPTWQTLRHHLAVIAITDTDAVAALRAAYHTREVDTAADVAAVLDWRLDDTGNHSLGRGPLPWLTGIPHPLLEHPVFGPYLNARADLVAYLAARVGEDATAWTAAQAPRWARPLLGDDTAALLADLAVWRAAVAVADEDRRPTGADRYAIRERRYQRGLAKRVSTLLGSPDRAAARWEPLARRIEPRLVEDPYWPVLADRLTAAARAGTDIAALAEAAAAQRPLPDELPAAALWWRLAAHLDPASIDNPNRSPEWIPALHSVLGLPLAERVVADAAWPALLAAVEDAEHHWLPADILALAAETLSDRAEDDPLTPKHLAAALAARVNTLAAAPAPDMLDIATLAEHEPVDVEQAPPDPADYPAPPPPPQYPGQHTATTTDTADEDYLAAVMAQQPPDQPVDIIDTPPATLTDLLAGDGVLVDWDITTATAPTPLPYPELPPAQRVTRLRADLDTARATAALLWSQHLAGDGEHQRAAAPMVRAMRQRADAQIPHRVAAHDAHHAWVRADHAATTAEQAHAGVEAAAAAARARGDDLEALSLELEAAALSVEARAARADATEAQAAAEQAQQAWQDFAGAHGTVTPEHVEAIQASAAGLDLDTITAARNHAELIEGQLLRAESAAAREDADSDFNPLEEQPLTAPRTPVATLTRPPADTRRRRLLPSAADIAERLRGNRLQVLTHTALADEITLLREQIRKARGRPTDTALSPTAVADRVRSDHARLRGQADAIQHARSARTAADTLADELQRARDQLTALTTRRDTQPPRGRRRRELDAAITAAETAVEALLTDHQQAQTRAADARSAAIDLGAYPQHWDEILERVTDLDGYDKQLSSAIAEDNDRAQRHAQRHSDTIQRITALNEALRAALAEQQRRDNLDDQIRDEEDHIRATLTPEEPEAPLIPGHDPAAPHQPHTRRNRRTSSNTRDTRRHRGPTR